MATITFNDNGKRSLKGYFCFIAGHHTPRSEGNTQVIFLKFSFRGALALALHPLKNMLFKNKTVEVIKFKIN